MFRPRQVLYLCHRACTHPHNSLICPTFCFFVLASKQKTAFPRGGLSEYESSGFSGFLYRLRRAFGGGSSSSSSSSTSALPVASASASSLSSSSSWCWHGINSFCWMLTCCKGRLDIHQARPFRYCCLTTAFLFVLCFVFFIIHQRCANDSIAVCSCHSFTYVMRLFRR